MKKLLVIPVVALCALLFAACGGKYRHPVGNCFARDGHYRIDVRVLRDEGVSEEVGKKILLKACSVKP